jgi:hypothetical protein
MPRRSRPPAGTSVGATGNRSDRTQAPAAPTGMGYGAHKETIQAQQAIPLPAAPPPAGAPPAPGGPAPGPGGNDRLAQALALAKAMPAPNGGLAGPTSRPNEPVTSGLPSGPGAGPEALAIAQPSVGKVFERLAYATGDPDMAILAQIAHGYQV